MWGERDPHSLPCLNTGKQLTEPEVFWQFEVSDSLGQDADGKLVMYV